jgi:acetyl-CoA carboxylase biotin carboxyl carrier protein
VTGTAGLSFFLGTAPVIATVMMTGWTMSNIMPPMPPRELTYEDLVQIVELIKSASHFSEFRLKVGDIEVSLRRGRDSVPAVPAAGNPVETAPGVRPAEQSVPEGLAVVRAPMVGTFYRAPTPGAPPFVQVGSAVEPATQVGIIEVMKLMNAIEAGVKGVVREVLAANAEPVEHGQPLLLIEPR